MSEANAPFNPQGQPEPNELSCSPWDEPPAKEANGADVPNSVLAESLHLDMDISQIFDVSELDEAVFEDSEIASERLIASNDEDLLTGVSAVASQSQVITPASIPVNSVADNLSSIAAWSQDGINPMESPNLSDLVTLIQELNQCNGALMDRVSQLEEALEYSQNALQAEVGRTQEVQSVYNAQDWTMVQEQVTTLFNQLEFAHQANQRQQILIETLTGQLENSQERVAQLEREAALIQQHYNEQAQQLSKSESTCRDLQSRLQRQQRYTLQFKAALEKCLEVPTPQYEIGAAPPETPVEPLTEAPFLPKAQRIQPWSAHTQAPGNSPWMKLQHLDLPPEAAPTAAESQPEVTNNKSASDLAPTTHLNLPSFGLPLLQVAADDEGEISEAEAAIDRDLKEQVHRLTNDPALKQQLDAAVKPLADMLAEALLADQTSEQVEAAPEPTESAADQLLASVMADAEDALWQDLARLIDVSTEDVVKASLSGDLAAFESLDFTSLQSNQLSSQSSDQPKAVEPEVIEPAVVDLSRSQTDSVDSDAAAAVAPLIRRISQAPIQTAPVQEPSPEAVDLSQTLQEAIPALATSSWPSPVVYPLRPTKKRQSLAMVDLPTFPRG